jgi:undecaprenyl diphosphate synthase
LKSSKSPAASALPAHVAIIMDGNGRWAKKRGLPRKAGHAAGSENFRTIARYCKNLGIKYLTVFAFSTENWRRPPDEVDAIMSLLEKYLDEAIDTMERDGICLRILGDVSRLSPALRERIRRTEEISKRVSGFQANVCLNYGGRDEILRAARSLAEDTAQGRLDPSSIDEDVFSSRLWTADIPDPELIIRPSGELRLSNFLLWQCAYSEFYFTDVLWPDFSTAELDKALASFGRRERRFGGVG